MRQHLRDRQTALFDAGCERLPIEQRHHEVVDTVGVADVVEAADVRMLQCGHDAGLALEAAAQLRVASGLGGEHLECDAAIEPRVTGLVDLAHAAGAERCDHLVGADAVPA